MSDRTAQDVAVDREERFETYAVALTFTILGLGIQTAKLGTYVLPDVLELVGWVSLMVSGLTGLRRMQIIPRHYLLQHYRNTEQERVHETGKILHRNPSALGINPSEGTTIPLRDYISQSKAMIPEIDTELEKSNSKAARLYRWQVRGFVAGIVVLATARAVPAVAHLLRLLGYRLI